MINIKILTQTPEPKILAMEPDSLLLRKLLIEGPWNHRSTRETWKSKGGTHYVTCLNCDTQRKYHTAWKTDCTVPPPLPKSLAEYMVEVVQEVWPNTTLETIATVAKSIMYGTSSAANIKMDELQLIKAALLYKKREIG